MKKIHNRSLKVFFLFIFFTNLHAQKKIKALFIGNSYTYANNLPQLIQSLSLVNGDTLQWDSYTPGGYTLQMHSNDATTLSKIAAGGWDFVILQAQSQEPSFDSAYVVDNVFPYARKLDSLIHLADSCTETVFFMTWGRKNGDAGNCAAYPQICTYAGMQGKLRERYLQMGFHNQATVSPVGCVWREVVNQNQAFDLYQSDQSHPSLHGSYLAACVFYELLFQRSVFGNTFVSSLSLSDASILQQTTHQFFSDSLPIFTSSGNIPVSSFTIQQNGNQIQCNPLGLNVAGYQWDFGDGFTSSSSNPTHNYQNPGTFTITLNAYNTGGCIVSSSENSVTILPLFVKEQTRNAVNLYFNDESELVVNGLISGQASALKIYVSTGQLMREMKFISDTEVNFPLFLSPGIYLIQICSGDVEIRSSVQKH